MRGNRGWWTLPEGTATDINTRHSGNHSNFIQDRANLKSDFKFARSFYFITCYISTAGSARS